jgi:hypothetical protein
MFDEVSIVTFDAPVDGAGFGRDDLAYDICRKLYGEFDIADEGGIKELILARVPNAKLKLSERQRR